MRSGPHVHPDATVPPGLSWAFVRFAFPFAFRFVATDLAPLVRAEVLRPDGRRAGGSPSLSLNFFKER